MTKVHASYFNEFGKPDRVDNNTIYDPQYIDIYTDTVLSSTLLYYYLNTEKRKAVDIQLNNYLEEYSSSSDIKEKFNSYVEKLSGSRHHQDDESDIIIFAPGALSSRFKKTPLALTILLGLCVILIPGISILLAVTKAAITATIFMMIGVICAGTMLYEAASYSMIYEKHKSNLKKIVADALYEQIKLIDDATKQYDSLSFLKFIKYSNTKYSDINPVYKIYLCKEANSIMWVGINTNKEECIRHVFWFDYNPSYFDFAWARNAASSGNYLSIDDVFARVSSKEIKVEMLYNMDILSKDSE